MNTLQLIEQFLKEQNIQIPTRDFVEKVSNIYHKYESQQYDDSHFSIELAIPHWSNVLDNIYKELIDKKDLRLLDFGCGTGFATNQILNSKVKDKCSQLVCYDLSPDMVDVCKEKFKAFSNITYLSNREGLENLITENGKFNLIICNSLIHHILDHKSIFTVFGDLLTNDGILIIGHEPNRNFYQNSLLQKVSSIFRLYKKMGLKIKSTLGINSNVKKGNDISSLTYKELISKGLVSNSFPDIIIQKFVDIHVPISGLKQQPWGELGFNAAFFNSISDNKLKVIKQLSYNHIKDQEAYKSIFWKSISKLLKMRYPNDGADAIFVLIKNSNSS